MSRKIVIAGGTGQIGTMMARTYHARGDQVVVLGRTPREFPWVFAKWDGKTLGDWAEHIDGANIVINLAGRSVNCRYTDENRRAIMDSRVDSTRVLGEAISAATRPPEVWLQSSTATIYSHSVERANDEFTGTIDQDEPGANPSWKYSVQVAKNWEKTLDEADTPNTRKVALRSAMVMSPDREGIFDVMLGIVRRGLGGTAGNGKQYISWIHHQDFLDAIDFIVEQELDGVINLAAPNPLPNREFMKIFRETWGTSIGLPATEWMLEIGAVFMKTETELLLKSRRVVPGLLLKEGFTFAYPEWTEAAVNLCEQWRAENR